MYKLFTVIALSMYIGYHVTVMVSAPGDVYWAHWALFVGVMVTVVTNTLDLLDKLKLRFHNKNK